MALRRLGRPGVSGSSSFLPRRHQNRLARLTALHRPLSSGWRRGRTISSRWNQDWQVVGALLLHGRLRGRAAAAASVGSIFFIFELLWPIALSTETRVPGCRGRVGVADSNSHMRPTLCIVLLMVLRLVRSLHSLQPFQHLIVLRIYAAELTPTPV